jgi:hypothetical protein|tara:strand:- start:2168 stop:2530 length:363 start_codon:yes stop_codon:yes gene_type:complete
LVALLTGVDTRVHTLSDRAGVVIPVTGSTGRPSRASSPLIFRCPPSRRSSRLPSPRASSPVASRVVDDAGRETLALALAFRASVGPLARARAGDARDMNDEEKTSFEKKGETRAKRMRRE